jgi:hypothetical protein
MSHVRRKPSPQSRRVARRKKSNRMLSILIIGIIIISGFAGILLIAFGSP